MKKYLFVISLAAAIIVLQGASVWEGAAAVSVDFPDSGLYVATNSFPKNTVVDLTNLETGKTVRVIVSAGLETPGLLALISKEAADAIGLRSRTVGRIRMISPQDPIAFSRFSEEYRSGDPDYDPLAAVEEVYGKETASSTEPAPANLTEPSNGTTPSPAVTDTPLRNDPDSYWADTVTVVPLPPVDEPKEDDTLNEIVDDKPETSEAIAMAAAPNLREPILTDLPQETIPEPEITPPVEPVYIPPAISPDPKENPPEYSYTLIPADERPPENVPVEEKTPEAAYAAPNTTVPQIFSVPSVSQLEKGKYYLQLGAYSHTPAVEQELCKIERSYPVAVQYVTVSGKNVYRILIGPINQGESGALLKKFKGLGYKDAFVRRG